MSSAASPTPSDMTQLDSPIVTPVKRASPLPVPAIKSSGKEQQHTLGLYYAPSLPLEPSATAVGLETVDEPSKAPTVINLFADANLGLGLGLADSVTEKLANSSPDQRQQQQAMNTEQGQHVWAPYFQTTPQPLQGPPPSAPQTSGYFQPQPHPESAPPTPYYPHQNAISPTELNVLPPFLAQHEHIWALRSPSIGTSDARLATGSSAPASVSGEVTRVKRKSRVRSQIDDDERERRAERRRQINRKSARNFREKRKTEFEALEQVNADHVATIQRLERELAAERTERVRLEAIVRTRGRK